MTDQDRAMARELAQRHIADGNPMGWFEVLYATAGGDSSIIPWADLALNPNLVRWLEQQSVAGSGRKALKIGCGLGDDAEELFRRGFDTTAFDISPTAISWCRRRFSEILGVLCRSGSFQATRRMGERIRFRAGVLHSTSPSFVPPRRSHAPSGELCCPKRNTSCDRQRTRDW